MKWFGFNREKDKVEDTVISNNVKAPKDISAILYAIEYLKKCQENLTTEELNTSEQIRKIESSFKEVLNDNSKLNDEIDSNFRSILSKIDTASGGFNEVKFNYFCIRGCASLFGEVIKFVVSFISNSRKVIFKLYFLFSRLSNNF